MPFGYCTLRGLTRGNGAVTSDTFDAASRLVSLTHDPAGAGFDVTFGYAYNPASQMTSRLRSNAAYDWVLRSGLSFSPRGYRCYVYTDTSDQT